LRVDWRQGWEAEFGLAPSCVAESSQMFRDEAQAISKRTEINDFDKLPVKIKALRLLP
jgi:hypothetical protein